MIETARLILRPWTGRDRAPLAAMHTDPEVMWDQGGSIDRAASDAKLERYQAAIDTLGFGRWALEDAEGAFVGYTGVTPARPGHVLGAHLEVGWRLVRAAWGRGYATEAARASLDHVLTMADVNEVLSYTAADNFRSQAVMARLGLRRDPARDFVNSYEGAPSWAGLVWVAERTKRVS